MTTELPVSPWRRWSTWGFWLYLGHLVTVDRLALSNVLIALLVLASPALLRAAGARQVLERAAPLLVPIGFYLLFHLTAVLFSVAPRQSVSSLSEWLSLAAVPLGVLLLASARSLRRVIDLLTVAGAVYALVGLGQLLRGAGGIDARIVGPFTHWMTFSGVLLIIDLLLLARLVLGPRLAEPHAGWQRAWRWLAAGLINVALVASLTRSAWLGALLAVLVMVALRAPRLLWAAVPAGLVMVLLAPIPVLHRAWSIVDLAEVSNYDRLCMAAAGVDMVAERPLFGLGPNQVKERYAIYRHPSAPRSWVPHLHNSFLELAAERGLPALGALLWWFGAAGLISWRTYHREGGAGGPRADLWAGTFLALLAFAIAGCFENNWGDTEVQRLALFVLTIPAALSARFENDGSV